MLMQDEHDKPVDRSFLPYQQLAVAVIETALVDFGVMNPSQRRGRPVRTRLDRTIEGKLSTLRLQILAGAFLVERSDPQAIMWFRLSGLNHELMRRRKPHWPFRLRAMREREEKLAAAMRRQKQDQLATNKEVRRGERDQSVGRHPEQPGGLPGRGLPEADRVGANAREREEDVLRRTWSPAAYLHRPTDWPRHRPHGQLVSALGFLPWLGEVPARARVEERLTC